MSTRFKKSEQYHFGKLHSGHTVKFVRTPKRKILSGEDLSLRGIKTFAEYYEKNPNNFRVGENISICVQDENGLYKCLMSKTILQPIQEEGLSDNGHAPLNTDGYKNNDENLVKSYQGQITYLQQQLQESERLKNEYQSQVIEKAQEVAELEVDHSNLQDKYDEQKKEFDEFKKEFGDIVKEARNPAPATLSDKLGDMVQNPEVMGVLTELGSGLAGFLKSKIQNVPTGQNGLNDGPPPHYEQPQQTIKDDEAEVFE